MLHSMWATAVRPLATALAGLLLLFVSASQGKGQDDFKAANAWFDTLGYPDFSKSKLVKVATGQFHLDHFGVQKKEFLPAFHLRTEGDSFKVFTLNLRIVWYTKSRYGPELGRVGYEVVDLKKSFEDYAASIKKEINTPGYSEFLNSHLWQGEELFLLARYYAKNGFAREADTLFALSRQRIARSWTTPNSPRQNLIDALARNRLLAAINDCADPALSRRDLLKRFEDIVQHYPEGQRLKPEEDDDPAGHAKQSQAYVEILRRMIAEDDEHARKPPKDEKQLDAKERAAELIYRLRDQPDIDVDENEARKASTPYAQLVALGYAAVPQLIEALDDTRLTRTVDLGGFNNHQFFAIRRIGDYAFSIIESIAQMHFNGDTKAAVAWWAEFQKKEERQLWIDGVRAGKWSNHRQAYALLRKYPADAWEALMKGIENAEDESLKGSLIQIAGKIEGERTTTFLREQFKAKSLPIRLVAAQALLDRGIDDGVTPMIDEWRRLPMTATGEDGVDELLRFLVRCGRPDAIRAVGTGMTKRTLRLQMNIISELAHLKDVQLLPLPFAVRQARDEILVRQLANTERAWGTGGHWGGEHQIDNPRLCDVTASYLVPRPD